jgi:FtsH-binding integral membrane protein
MGLIQTLKNDVANGISVYRGLGLTASVFSFLQGRATAFAILFASEGVIFIALATWGFIHGRDLTGLGSVITAISGLDAAIFAGVVGHSLKEDYFERKRRQDDATK